uniref:Uncharacterized protein n=1 Tax=Thiomonas intermedia (strain K12) TaxID=75379 RepID=D5X4X9_THIK1
MNPLYTVIFDAPAQYRISLDSSGEAVIPLNQREIIFLQLINQSINERLGINLPNNSHQQWSI